MIEAPPTPAAAPRKRKAKAKNEIIVDLYAAWPRFRNALLKIEARCFGPNSDNEKELEHNIKESLFLAVIRKDDEAFGYCLVERRWPDTAYVAITAIDPEYRSKGHLKTLIDAVEAELKKIGYAFIERNARIEFGYADKVTKHYGDRVLVAYDHGSRIGPLRFFRIAL